MRTRSRTASVALLTALALLASACGGGGSSAETAAAAGGAAASDTDDAAAAADANISELESNEDVRLIEILDVESGAVTTLANTVDGDKPVLIWFWAPH